MGVDVHDYGQEHVCDIRTLPFETGAVDAVMAIHVLEHFYVWEVEAVLGEWIRVLRLGGRLIIEVPDFGLAVERLAKGIDDPQLTWWVLYGDPSSQNTLQCHHWGWTRSSLEELMHRCGLIDICQEVAQYKLKARRDIRVVGTKRS